MCKETPETPESRESEKTPAGELVAHHQTEKRFLANGTLCCSYIDHDVYETRDGYTLHIHRKVVNRDKHHTIEKMAFANVGLLITHLQRYHSEKIATKILDSFLDSHNSH